MDKQKILDCCDRILLAANNISVMGEKNMTNLQGVCQLARLIRAEAERPEPKCTESPGMDYSEMKKAEVGKHGR